MISVFPIPEIKLPTKRINQSYKEYDKEISEFLALYLKYYDYRKRRKINFYESFRDDFFDDPSYSYVIKYMYKKGLDFSKVRSAGSTSFSKIKRRIPRKEMFKRIPAQERMPFMRWGSDWEEEKYRNKITEIFKDYISD